MTIRGFGGDYGEYHLFHPVSETELLQVERRRGSVLPPDKITIVKGEKGLELATYYNDEIFSTFDHYRSTWDDFDIQEDLCGRYYSEDLDTYYTVFHKDSRLTLSPRGGKDLLFFQNLKDEFRAESRIIEVQRNESGRVTGFVVFLGATQEVGIDFEKLKE
jgi:hypothetical protein